MDLKQRTKKSTRITHNVELEFLTGRAVFHIPRVFSAAEKVTCSG